MRQTCHSGGTILFSFPRVSPHEDVFFELDLGRDTSTSVCVTRVSFAPFFGGLGPVPRALEVSAGMSLFMDTTHHERGTDYRWQQELRNSSDVSFVEYQSLLETDRKLCLKAEGRPIKDASLAACDMEKTGSEKVETLPEEECIVPIFGLKNVGGMIRLALFSPIALCDVAVEVLVVNKLNRSLHWEQQQRYPALLSGPGGDLRDEDDMFHPWRMSRNYFFWGADHDVLIEWFRVQRTRLILRSVELTNSIGKNPLHVLCDACGSARLAKIYLENIGRFINPEQEDHEHCTPIMRLFRRSDIYDSSSPLYFAALELLELFIRDAAVAVDQQDVNGDTIVHYACRFHKQDSILLPKILSYGAHPNVKNNAGHTPIDVARDPQYKLLHSDIADAEKHLTLREEEFVRSGGAITMRTRKIRSLDSLPPKILRSGGIVDDGKGSGMVLQGGKKGIPRIVPTDSSGLPASDPAIENTPIEKEEGHGVSHRGSSAQIHERAVSTTSIPADGTDGSHTTSDVSPLQPKESLSDKMEIQLRAEFAYYDKNSNGVLSANELRHLYENLESFGVVQCANEIDNLLFGSGGPRDVHFDEFAALMLRLNSR